MFYIFLNHQRRPALCDSGCTRSCISYEYYVNNPYLKRFFVPYESCGTAINGSDVPSIGEIRLKFTVQGIAMSITCKIIKGLMDHIILGWDWMCKYSVSLDASSGSVKFNDKSAPLIENHMPAMDPLYRVFEDIVLPPHSKIHTNVELVIDSKFLHKTPKTVITEPFSNNGASYWAARGCSYVKDDRFLTEFINPTEVPIKIPAGEIIGFAQFTDDDEFNASHFTTEMSCEYGGDPLHTEPKPQSFAAHRTDTHTPNTAQPESTTATPPPKPTPKTSTPPNPPARQKSHVKEWLTPSTDIPPGAKPLKVDLTVMSPDARPYEEQLTDLFIRKHEKVFSKHDRDYGKTGLIQYRAHLKDPDQNPISHPPYRTRPEMREVIDQQAHEMIADGLVCHSKSAYSAPILLNRKKCGGWRFLTDFRKINDCCTKVVFPLPRIEDSIHRLENPKFFSSMDLTKGFWQIPIHPDDRKYFAFSTESMHLEYLVAPMGSKNSPSYLSALMQLVLRGLPIQHVISYLDDILVADSNMEDHIKHLDLVLSALEKANLKLNPSKCEFARESVICLGHKLSREGISPDPANIAKIKSWKAPDNVKKLRAFLGLTGYYRQFVKNYSEIAGCLTDLTRDDCKWHWHQKHQDAFDTLRNILVSDQIMAYPDFTKTFTLKSDASLTAIGYILTQKVDNKEKVVSYGSKKLNRTQQRWSTYDREFFALLSGIRANSHYLRHARFIVVTDHRPLLAWKKVDSQKDPTGRRTRWAIELDNYEFDLIYKKGKIHCDADAMSRRGDDDDEVAEDSDDFFRLSLLLDEDNDDNFYLLGMTEDSDHTLVQFHSEHAALKRLKRRQDSDPIISEVKSFTRKHRRLPRSYPCTWYKRNNRWLIVKDGILYRKSYCELVNAKILQVVIPDSMVSEVLEELHGSEWAGHPPAEKMITQARRYAIWPTMSQDIKQLVKDCKVCDQLREPVPKPVAPLQPIVATKVFDHVMCDLISFPVPSFGFKYVLIFKDVFSGFIRCYKLRDKTTKGVVKALEDLVCLLGPPKQLTSDNGGEFASDMLREACRLLGIEKRTSVPYRPQSQGNVERQNRTLIKDLQHRLLQYGKSWSEHLPYVEWLHNTMPFSKTRMSPYYVFFGREPYLPQFADTQTQETRDVKTQAFAKELKTRLKSIHDEANRRAEERRQADKERYDRRVKHNPFEPGDKVWERVEVRHKLDPKWSGPITIRSRRASPRGGLGNTYNCERSDGTTCRRNYEQLKRVNARFEENMQKPLEKPPQKPKSRSSLDILAIVCPQELPEHGGDATAGPIPIHALPLPSPPTLASPPIPALPSIPASPTTPTLPHALPAPDASLADSVASGSHEVLTLTESEGSRTALLPVVSTPPHHPAVHAFQIPLPETPAMPITETPDLSLPDPETTTPKQPIPPKSTNLPVAGPSSHAEIHTGEGSRSATPKPPSETESIADLTLRPEDSETESLSQLDTGFIQATPQHSFTNRLRNLANTPFYTPDTGDDSTQQSNDPDQHPPDPPPPFRQVRRKIHLPPDTREVDTVQTVGLQGTGEVNTGRNAQPSHHEALLLPGSMLIASRTGQIPVPVITLSSSSPELISAVAQQNAPQPETLPEPNLPDPSQQRMLKTKMKTTGHRSQSRSAEPAYSSIIRTRAQSVAEREVTEDMQIQQPRSCDPPVRKPRKRSNVPVLPVPRDSRGKFLEKSAWKDTTHS